MHPIAQTDIHGPRQEELFQTWAGEHDIERPARWCVKKWEHARLLDKAIGRTHAERKACVAHSRDEFGSRLWIKGLTDSATGSGVRLAIRRVRPIGPHCQRMTPQVVAELHDLGRRHRCLSHRPVVGLGAREAGPVACRMAHVRRTSDAAKQG